MRCVALAAVAVCCSDKNKGDEAAHKKFMDVNEANEILSDPDKRATYGQHLRVRRLAPRLHSRLWRCAQLSLCACVCQTCTVRRV